MPQEDRVSGQERARHQKGGGGGDSKKFLNYGYKSFKDLNLFCILVTFSNFIALVCKHLLAMVGLG